MQYGILYHRYRSGYILSLLEGEGSYHRKGFRTTLVLRFLTSQAGHFTILYESINHCTSRVSMSNIVKDKMAVAGSYGANSATLTFSHQWYG